METLLDKMNNCDYGLAIDLEIIHTNVPCWDYEKESKINEYLSSFTDKNHQYAVIARSSRHLRIRKFYNLFVDGDILDCKMNPQKLSLFQRKMNTFGLKGKEMYKVKMQIVKDNDLSVLDWFAEIVKTAALPGVNVNWSQTLNLEEAKWLRDREMNMTQTQPAKIIKKNMTKDEKIFNYCQTKFQDSSPSDEELFCAICEHLVSINTIKINPDEICDYVCGVKLKLGFMDSKELFRESRMSGNK